MRTAEALRLEKKQKVRDKIWGFLMEPGVVERLQKLLEKDGIKIE